MMAMPTNLNQANALMALYQQQAQQMMLQQQAAQTTAAYYGNNSVWTGLGLMGTSTTTSTLTVPLGGLVSISNPVYDDGMSLGGSTHLTIPDGSARTITLPDGSTIDVKADGSYTIEDTDAQVTYRANRVRDFNSFVNASDKLEAFIRFCGEVGVRQGEMLDIPIKHFIAWLIVEAAHADGEEPQTALPDLSAYCEGI